MIEAIIGWARKIPGRVWLAAGCVLVAALWLLQHDANIRRQAELQQVRRQTSAQVAALKKQARQDAEQANVIDKQALQKLEARRQQMDRQNRQLAAQLTELRKQAQIQADEVATLPISETVKRVAAQLGLKPEDLAAPASGHQDVTATNGSAGVPTGGIAGDHAPSSGGATPAVGTPPLQNTPGGGDAAAPGSVALALTGSGARKVETALVGLKACLAESSVESQQVAACQARAEADDASIQRLNGSVASLNQALQAKDVILKQQAGEYQAELRAARGTFFGRLVHTAEHVAIGVAVGVAIGVVVR